jgi:hypothetical protein
MLLLTPHRTPSVCQGDACSQSSEAESAAAGWGTLFSFTTGGIGMVVAPLFTMVRVAAGVRVAPAPQSERRP